MSDSEVKKLLAAVDNKEICAVGIYIVEDGFRIAEVAFEIDWDEHQKMIGVYGEHFDTDQPGWKDGVSPEAYIAAQNLVKLAKGKGKKVHSWIRISSEIPKGTIRYKEICRKLGYSYDSSLEPWKNIPIEQSRDVNYLPEAKVTQRIIELE